MTAASPTARAPACPHRPRRNTHSHPGPRRYAYNLGMDGNVLTGHDARCINLTASTVGNHMQHAGVKTAFIGKYDVG